jgi:acyl-coenzyme A synthetase/AMP-(fatty) acid ligase/acyl carrier protein
LNQTPAAFRPLAAVACAAPASDQLALRRVIFGGEALELEALRPWFERFGDDKPQLINMYGITETTVHVTYRPLRHADLARAACSPIGEPIDDLALYVLDASLEPCSWGVTGELYVGGAGLARGYLGRAALSAERFIPNPFGAGRLYRSGDLALRRADGGLEYLGRSDHQVKIRGFRIELGEIAAQLQAHTAVREAAVIARPGPSGQRLVGYVTLQAGTADEAAVSDELKVHLRRALPEYMVPAAIIVLSELPLTVNGKLDRNRLPEQAQRTAAFVRPSSEIERQLAQIWSELLGCALERIGNADDFFELGGHSLLITQVASRVHKQFGVVLPLRQLFEVTKLQALAACIAEAGAAGGAGAKLDALDALLSELENES